MTTGKTDFGLFLDVGIYDKKSIQMYTNDMHILGWKRKRLKIEYYNMLQYL